MVAPIIIKENRLSPILKWAGGKEQELKYIIDNSRIQKDSIFSNLDIHNAINDLFTSEYMCENGIKQISKNKNRLRPIKI